MDNDPKHTSKRAWRWLLDNNVKTMVWPAESPDLNPIEPVWHELKNYLRQMKPENKDDLVAKIKQFWSERMTMSQCRRYVAHIRNVLPLVVQNKGGPT
jgi:transposase